jgi:hypothetical protein
VRKVIKWSLRIGLALGLLGGLVWALTKVLGAREDRQPALGEVDRPWPRLEDDPTEPASAMAWVEPNDGVCPTSHPVKAKLSSKIFHLPGMLNYERTHPDRCYLDATKAEADGLRAAKR